MPIDQQWAFSSEPSSEYWTGPFATKDEAIVEALAYYGDPEDGFKPCVATCHPARPEDDMGDDFTFIVDGDPEVLLMPLFSD